MSLQVGTAKVNITPPLGCLMAGYGGRTHGAVGVRDELWARALYITDGTTEVALVALELLGLYAETVQAIRSRVQREAGIPQTHIFVSASHTHSGPVYDPRDDELSARSLATTEDKIVGVVSWAKASSRAAGVRFGRAAVQCGVNRRERRDGRIVLGINPDGPVYPYVDTLEVVAEDGVRQAVWFCHPCHPVVMGSSNYLLSGDYAGAASRFVEANGAGLGLFVNGCAANINSLPHNAGFEDVDRLGARLGAAVIQSLTEAAAIEHNLRVTSHEHAFHLPVEAVPTVEEALAEVRAAEEECAVAETDANANRLFWGRRRLRDARERLTLANGGEPPPGVPLAVQVVRLGDTAILGIPGEVFIELGTAIQAQSPFARTIVVGYTNGSPGYLPTREAFADGGYEVGARARRHGLQITADAADVLVSECAQALRESQRKAM